MENKIEIVRGTTNNFTLYITDENGAPYSPYDGDMAIMGVKRRNRCGKLLITKKCRVSADGSAFFTLRPEDTIGLCCEKYVYDIGLQSGDDFYIIIPETEFKITRNNTYKGCVK